VELAVLGPHFAPDVAPTGDVMTRIVLALADRGHQLHVVTSLPWYLHHRVEPEWRGKAVRRERTEWGSITRVNPFPTDKTSIPQRAAGFAAFSALTGVVAAAGRPVDGVFAMSPPLTLGLTGWGVHLVRRGPLVFNVQDVFPDVAVELGTITNRRLIAVARAVERVTYHRSGAVTVLSDDLRDNLVAKVRPEHAAKIRVIPNFVDTDVITRHPSQGLERETAYRAEHGLTGRTVVMYAGNLGHSQSIHLLLDAAAALRERYPNARFVVNGGGVQLPDLQRRAATEGLDNVVFVGLQPKDRIAEVLASADVHVVLLKRGLARSSVPSKTYSNFAAARPVVASIDDGTEVARMIDAAGCGEAVPPDDAAAFIGAVDRMLARSDAERAELGAKARAWVERWLSPAAVAERYEALFDELRDACAR
jgi:colanic acid biosynthesis glycosyl transferase WcaI